MITWRGGTEVPYLPPPARAPPPGAASPGPGDARSPERLGAGEGTRCQAHPVLALAHEPPCQHKHDPGQPMQLAWKRQCWPSQAWRSQPRGQDVGQEGPVPNLQHAGTRAVSRRGRRAWRRDHVLGLVPRGMETPGTGASLLSSQESSSAPEPCGCGSQNSTAGDSIGDHSSPTGPPAHPALHLRPAVGGSSPGLAERRAMLLPAPGVPAAVRGHVFCISSIPAA